MFPWLYDTLFRAEWPWSMLRLFRYPFFCAMAAALTAFLLCVLATPFFARAFRRGGFWERTRHFSLLAVPAKRHVPTMGGAVIVGVAIASILLWCRLGDPQVWLLCGVAAFLAAVGCADDLRKIARGRGLSRGVKYAAAFAVAGAVTTFVCVPALSPFQNAEFRWAFYIPCVKEGFAAGALLVPFLILFLVYAVNAVNITDGMDGLAAVPVIFTGAVLGVMAYVLAEPEYVSYLLFFPSRVGGQTVYQTLPSMNIAVAAAALCGAMAGFLWHNAYPATVIMGDTGSLAVGGVLGTIAVLLKQEALFLLAGGVFLLETAASWAQDAVGLGIFGRRFFSRAPLHDALLLKGTGESKVTIRLWLLSALLAVLALITLKVR
ncbi:MAG TPA: phospho-N-acetylmuramoyl-pentapeptide-transferase [Planctomycetota bacterium]|jgi:phospho-N-acetylmuramoyl-pentapeptide-transferase|nr:phospho-N-acetylmuramoyl-pentapeptide-transferase [Planctomycetota bacterium]OQC21261.1 MAG: Phospho-N-acetylmuramoyl-pentapeptide-transferase [Planctomycetes bacterium ADurb.Bin069]NMD35816.1 phospho-N-acetylmuramoyl-pentapeptide-transferase [Planctomycetota bacterium]HNR99207.1 phospho-N-acetylmuramoyl-pentapeptide-transferase [Planctomycetota bacterium]HNU25280.1 phospho-N-acetylmuramoyl-pentapeptide-transferase [Planctomycetota bacterium]